MLRILSSLARIAMIMLIFGVVLISYILFYYSRDLPDYSQLKEYHPPCVTRIYSADGILIEEYARENRIFVPISKTPLSLKQAFIAAEDKNYYNHPGIDVVSILRAAIANVQHFINKKRVEGGSTITQQVVKNFLLSSERSFERKIKEAILSYMISQTLNKEQVLELYLNQIYLGKGAHGVAAAALTYFNKSVEELTLNESAILASMPKAPSKYNPERNYRRAFERKNYVLKRMFDDGYITQEQAKEAMIEPIILRKRDKVETVSADYYAQQVREEVIGMFSEEFFYTAGLTIITCLDSKMQGHINNSLSNAVKKFDVANGYRGPIRHLLMNNWQEELALLPKYAGQKQDKLAVILDVHTSNSQYGYLIIDRVDIGFADGATTTISRNNMKLAKSAIMSGKMIFKRGDVIVVGEKNNNYFLSQIPEINGAVIALQPYTGRVLGASGGYDFDASKFNRVNQAHRQPGSLIKAFVYLAALETGAMPNEIFVDEPVEIEQGPNLPLWVPRNSDNKFDGPMTLRRGLERSRNLITIKVGLATGLAKVAEVVQRFGITDKPMQVSSLLLGAIETTLEKMVTAFAIIASNGEKVTPHYIEMIKDCKGNVIYRRDYAECNNCWSTEKGYVADSSNTGQTLELDSEMEDEESVVGGEIHLNRNLSENNIFQMPVIKKAAPHMITDSATSYQVTSILEGAVERGTSRRAKSLGKIIAGKTGTTNEAKDTWFIGYTPSIVVGVYMGYDQPRSLGQRAWGSTVALPVFVDFMKNAYKNYPSLEFKVPESIELIKTNLETGQYDENGIYEAFKKNDIPFDSQQNKRRKRSFQKRDVFEHIQDIDNSQELY